ncbi:hypothetical protein [Sedimentitalea sp.]|uniref:hypothetical protein n=1 Tax=Sedimentitalea sp. TaxID=2048915 RepID=UPI003297DDE0
MPTLTDYQTFQDTTRREALRFRFNLPSNFVEGTARAIPILMFRVDAEDDCTCWVHVNDSANNPTASNASIELRVTGSSGHKTMHELLRGTGFRRGRENQILIHKTPDATSGQFFVSDVVLMYQVEI